MSIKSFVIENIEHLDGGAIAEAVNQAIGRATQDCADRPGNKTDRKVGLTLHLTPKVDESGGMTSVNLWVEIKDGFPSRKSAITNLAQNRRTGQLVFNTMSPADAEQLSIDSKSAMKSAQE